MSYDPNCEICRRQRNQQGDDWVAGILIVVAVVVVIAFIAPVILAVLLAGGLMLVGIAVASSIFGG